MKPFVLGAIFARGGSKGIPRKNIKLLNKKPLIAYAVEVGLSIKLIDELIVSTDDPKIAGVARRYGAQVPFLRPKNLATDRSPELLSWRHAIETYERQTGRIVDVLVSIPTTSPLRRKEDIEACLLKLLKTDAGVVITVREAERSPYFNMVKIDKKGNANLVMPSRKAVTRRQQSPKVYDMTTVAYAARASFIRKAKSLFDGKVKAVVIPQERALDIDMMFDFKIAEFLIKRKVDIR